MFGPWIQEDSLGEGSTSKFSSKELETSIKKKINRAEEMVEKIGFFQPPETMSKFLLMTPQDVFQTIPQYQEYIDYYWQIWPLMNKNQAAFDKINQFDNNLTLFRQQVQQVERDIGAYNEYTQLIEKKKNRRVSKNIIKKFTCPFPDCFKNYGTDISLHLHIKIKHGGGNKSDREKLAVKQFDIQQQICEAEWGNKEMPKMEWNLPPGFLESWRKKFLESKSKPLMRISSG